MDYIYLIYDILMISFIAGGIISGSKKGFIRSVLGLAVYIAAIIGSGFISNNYTEMIYMQYIQPKIISVIEIKASDVASEISQRLQDMTDDKENNDETDADENKSEVNEKTDLTNRENSDKLNSEPFDFFRSLAEKLKDELPDKLCDEVERIDENSDGQKAADDLYSAVLAGDMKTAAEYTEQKAIRPVMLKILGYAVWSLSYMIITVIGNAAVRLISHVRDFSAVKSADSLLGGILGFVKGIIVCIVAAMIVQLIIIVTSDGFGILTEAYIEQTYIFRYIYRIITI